MIVADLQLTATDCSNLLMAISAYQDRHKTQDETGKLVSVELHSNMQSVKTKITQALTNIQNAYDLKRTKKD